ncbi:hypothetical protein ANO11243_010450 [Dothideomycetidae sp. 11243]|nr:hypothetical protein ANO11243_010450 [fungal sp. No.11243]
MFSFSQQAPEELVESARQGKDATWLSPNTQLASLMELCDQFIPDGEIAPVQMWQKVATALQAERMPVQNIPALQQSLGDIVECRGRGVGRRIAALHSPHNPHNRSAAALITSRLIMESVQLHHSMSSSSHTALPEHAPDPGRACIPAAYPAGPYLNNGDPATFAPVLSLALRKIKILPAPPIW